MFSIFVSFENVIYIIQIFTTNVKNWIFFVLLSY